MKNFCVLTLVLLASMTSFASYKCAEFPSTPHLAPESIEVTIGNNEAVLTIRTFEGRVVERTEVLSKTTQVVDGAMFSNANYELAAGFNAGLQLTRLSTNETVVCKK